MYAIIIIKVKRNPPPQHSSILVSERKLTVTLFIVTVVSILTILPLVSYGGFLLIQPASECPYRTYGWDIVSFLFYMNSMVNPLIYTIRMQEFRKAAKRLIGIKTQEPSCMQFTELPVMS